MDAWFLLMFWKMFLKIKEVSVNQITLIFRFVDPFAVLQEKQESPSHYKSPTNFLCSDHPR